MGISINTALYHKIIRRLQSSQTRQNNRLDKNLRNNGTLLEMSHSSLIIYEDKRESGTASLQELGFDNG